MSVIHLQTRRVHSMTACSGYKCYLILLQITNTKFSAPNSTAVSMAILLCIPSYLPVTTIIRPKSPLQIQQKPNCGVSLSSLHVSRESRLPLFSPTHQLSSWSSTTTTTKAVPAIQNGTLTEVRKTVEPRTFTGQEETVEHVVLYKMKDGTDEKTLINALNSLQCLPGVLYMSSGYVQRIHSPPGNKAFDIFLHSRHSSRAHLDLFMSHPLIYGFTMTYIEKDCEDYIILDYVHKHSGSLDHPKRGNTLRCAFFMLKPGWSQSQVQEVLRNSFEGCICESTYGDIVETSLANAERAKPNKGYNFGTIALFPSILELGTAPKIFAQELNNKLKDAQVENTSVFVVDYVIGEDFHGVV